MDQRQVDVLVSGAVVSGGHHLVNEPATVSKALGIAGGLQRKENMWPSGLVTIRRPLGERRVDVWQFDLSAPDADQWMSFELASGDSVTFQWHVSMTDDDARG